MAEQYANPSGWFGRLVTAGLLNRANRAPNQAALTALALNSQSRFLEVGFGGGELIFEIARHSNCIEIAGVDLSEAMVKRAQARQTHHAGQQRISFHIGAVQSLPFADNQFNRLCSINTVYFWPDLEAGCKEISRVMKSQCRVVLGFSTGTKLSQAGYTQHGFTFYEPEMIHQALAKYDLDLIHINPLKRTNKDTFYIATYSKND